MQQMLKLSGPAWRRILLPAFEGSILPWRAEVHNPGTHLTAAAPQRSNSALAELLPEKNDADAASLPGKSGPAYHRPPEDPIGNSLSAGHGAACSISGRASGNGVRSSESNAFMEGDPEHQRRLSEMARASANMRHALPSLEEAQQRLQSHRSASCSGQAPPTADREQPAAMDWREVVEGLHRLHHQAPLSGHQMLTDTFGRMHTYLRISLTERCNLRCLYCMPEEGVDLTPSQELLTTAEIMRLAGLFAEAGVVKVRLTGGEPTLRRDLVELVGGLRALPGVQSIGLTTNGLTLSRKLAALQSAGLSLLNISLDTLRPDRFERMTRRRGHERVISTIHHALALGFDPVKVNVVVMRGVNDDELCDFVELTRDAALNVRFIEYMPFDGNVWSDSKMVPYSKMLEAVHAGYPQGIERCMDPRGEVAKNFRVAGFRGSVSFITSMTKAFCADCNRLRLMADGNLKVCLFGANEVSLRDAMREGASEDDLRAIISAAVDRKKAAHAGMFELAKAPNRAMIKIGG